MLERTQLADASARLISNILNYAGAVLHLPFEKNGLDTFPEKGTDEYNDLVELIAGALVVARGYIDGSDSFEDSLKASIDSAIAFRERMMKR